MPIDRQLLYGHLRNRGLVEAFLRGHLWIEKYLVDLIRAHLAVPEAMNIERMGFAQKVQLGLALGAVSESDAGLLRTINSIRNRLAHNLDAEPTKADIDALVQHIGGVNLKVYQALMEEDETNPSDARRLECLVHSTVALLEWSRMNRQYEVDNEQSLSVYRLVRAVSVHVGQPIDDEALRVKYGVPDPPASEDIWDRNSDDSEA